MAEKSGIQSPRLIRKVREVPHQFEFFQAVRLIQLDAARASSEDFRRGFEIGAGTLPTDEAVRFVSAVGFAFPGATLSAPSSSRTRPGDERTDRPTLGVTFFGLVGASGVLPAHYTQLILDRGRSNDFSLKNFLDIFTHRAVSLFYRAWEKSRFAIGFERAGAVSDRDREDPLTQCLYALVGRGTDTLNRRGGPTSVVRRRLSVPDEAFVYFGGAFAHRQRSASGLGRILAAQLDVPVEIQQYRGQWLRLAREDQTALPTAAAPDGINCALGISAIAGDRVYTGESRFRIRLGPLSLEEFERFLPGRPQMVAVSEFTEAFVGEEYDFDIQPVLRGAEIAGSQLGGNTHLGWNSWVVSGSRAADGTEAVFSPRGNVWAST